MKLELRHIVKEFTPGQRAVDDLSLVIGEGTFVTLLGPSGCGKTTLLRIVAGFEQPTSGDVLHDGRVINHVPPYRRNFPMVFQSYALFPHMTVRANVGYGLRVRKLADADVARRVSDVLALLGLEGLAERRPAQLSGGQQQRVALARALVLEPPMILLDEPLSNLDAGLRVSMREEIRSLQQRLGITTLYVTHDQEEALAVSDRIVVMHAGRIEQDGSPREIHDTPRTERVARFMGMHNILPLLRSSDGIVLFGESFAAVPPQNAVGVLLRQDALHVHADGRFHATVERATYLGGRTRCIVHLPGGSELTLDVQDAGAARGAELRFDVVPERLHFLS